MKQCKTCQVQWNRQQKETLIPQVDSVRGSWEQIAADIFHLKGNDYLLVVDYFSSFPIVRRLTDKTASSGFAQWKSVFAKRSTPREFCGVNMPFNCAEFHEFADKWEFTLKTASPHHPQGIWERSVQAVKQLLKEANVDSTDPYLALLAYRTSPLCSDKFGRSPSFLSTSENILNRLPVLSRGEWTCGQKEQAPGRNKTSE